VGLELLHTAVAVVAALGMVQLYLAVLVGCMALVVVAVDQLLALPGEQALMALS
jgi:hypothetical protein